MPKEVGILLATFNGGGFLSDLLESLFSQSYKPSVIYVCDDHSEDDSVLIIEKMMKRSPVDIVLFRNSENIGVNKTFERLLTNANTEYVAFCDQDDIWHEDKLRISMEEIAVSEAELVYSDLEIMENGILKGSHLKSIGVKWPGRSYYKNPVTGCTIVAQRKALERCLPFSRYRVYDSWIYSTVFQVIKTHYINRRLVYYRTHNSNVVSRRRRFPSFSRIIKVLEVNRAFYCEAYQWFKSNGYDAPSNLASYYRYLFSIGNRRINPRTIFYLNWQHLLFSLMTKLLLTCGGFSNDREDS